MSDPTDLPDDARITFHLVMLHLLEDGRYRVKACGVNIDDGSHITAERVTEDVESAVEAMAFTANVLSTVGLHDLN